MAAGDGGRTKIAESRLTKGTSTYQRFYPRRPGLRAGHRLRLDLRRDRHRGGREQVTWPGTDPRLAVHNLIEPDHRQAQAGRDRLPDHQPEGAAGRLPGAAARRRAPGGGGRDQPEDRRDPGHGVVPDVQPEPATPRSTAPSSTRSTRGCRADPAQPLLNRAINETYPPGSSFKIITSSAGVLDRQGGQPEHHRSRPAAAEAAQRQPAEQRRRRDCAATATRRSSRRSGCPATPRSASSACSSAAPRCGTTPTCSA